MGEKELKVLLLERLHIELNLFKDSMLQKEKREIYEDSYKIEVFVNVYEILLEEIANLDAEIIRGLLHWRYSILGSLYQEWLTRDDCSYDELKAYAGNEVRVIAQPEDGKEDKDGTELGEAA